MCDSAETMLLSGPNKGNVCFQAQTKAIYSWRPSKLRMRFTPPHPAPCDGPLFGMSCQCGLHQHCSGTAHKHAPALLAPRQMPALPLRCTPPLPAPCNGAQFGISCQPMHCCGTALHTSMHSALLAPRQTRVLRLRLRYPATPRAMQWHPVLHVLPAHALCTRTAVALHTSMQMSWRPLLAIRNMPALCVFCTSPHPASCSGTLCYIFCQLTGLMPALQWHWHCTNGTSSHTIMQ